LKETREQRYFIEQKKSNSEASNTKPTIFNTGTTSIQGGKRLSSSHSINPTINVKGQSDLLDIFQYQNPSTIYLTYFLIPMRNSSGTIESCLHKNNGMKYTAHKRRTHSAKIEKKRKKGKKCMLQYWQQVGTDFHEIDRLVA